LGKHVSLIIGRRDDPHAAAVADAVAKGASVPVLLDAETLSRSDFVLDVRSGFVRSEHEDELIELRGTRAWLRRLAPEDWRTVSPPGGHEAVVRAAWMSALTSLIALVDVQWLSRLRDVFDAEDKLVQQRACGALGVRTPSAALVTRVEHIPTELGDPVVVKPVGPGHYLDATGRARVVHATEMALSDSRLGALAGAPFLVQQRIHARAHLRVVTVADDIWICELNADGTPLDWRAAEASHSSFRPSANPDVGAWAVAIARKLHVGYTSQDWVIDQAGDAHFLDLNPAGQWLFLPSPVRDQVTDAIARWLGGPPT
jgi:hypothetical protein